MLLKIYFWYQTAWNGELDRTWRKMNTQLHIVNFLMRKKNRFTVNLVRRCHIAETRKMK